MSGTIKAIERHMTPPSKREAVEPHAPKLVGEWQQRGPETFSGYGLRKLRLAFAPSQSTKLATVNRRRMVLEQGRRPDRECGALRRSCSRSEYNA